MSLAIACSCVSCSTHKHKHTLIDAFKYNNIEQHNNTQIERRNQSKTSAMRVIIIITFIQDSHSFFDYIYIDIHYVDEGFDILYFIVAIESNRHDKSQSNVNNLYTTQHTHIKQNVL